MAGFWKNSAKLLLLTAIFALLQVWIFPLIFSGLRIDLFLCLVVSLCVLAPFPYGFFAVVVISITLQAFSGAREGFIPFVYAGSYLILDVLKNILFIDTFPAQIIFSFVLSILINISSCLFSDMMLADAPWFPIVAGSLLTAAACPFVVRLTDRMLVKNEN